MVKKKSVAVGTDDNSFDGEGTRKASELVKQQANYRVYSTGSFMLDCAIGEKDPITGNGGIPERTIVEVFGKNQSFKTGLAEQLIKSVLNADPTNQAIVLYAEEPDMDRLESLGVDMDRTNGSRVLRRRRHKVTNGRKAARSYKKSGSARVG